MDFQQIAVGIHLLGFALGLGGATISDVMFLKALRSGQITEGTFSALSTLSKVIWVGLTLLILSGLTIFFLIYSEQGSLPMLSSPRWQMKLLLVAGVFMNGLVFNYKIFPFLRSLVGRTLDMSSVSSKIWSLAISGTVSILSWYSIFVISLLPRTFRPHLMYFIGAYLLVLLLGTIISKSMMAKIVSRG